MWYKNSESVGIKQRFGQKKQVVSFGGKRCSLTMEEQMELGKECVKKLNEGMPEADVNAWAKGEARRD